MQSRAWWACSNFHRHNDEVGGQPVIMVLPAVDAALQPAGFKPFFGNAHKLVPRVQYAPVRQHTSFVQHRERKRLVFHIICAKQRVSASLTMSAQRYCGLPKSRKRAARTPSTVTACLKIQVVEDNVHGVSVQGIECSAHGKPSQHSHRAQSRNQCHFRYAVLVSSLRLWPIGFMNPCKLGQPL